MSFPAHAQPEAEAISSLGDRIADHLVRTRAAQGGQPVHQPDRDVDGLPSAERSARAMRYTRKFALGLASRSFPFASPSLSKGEMFLLHDHP